MKEAEKLGIDFLGSIPLDTEIRKTSDEGKPITEINKSCEQSIQYQKIAEKVLSKVNTQKKSSPKIIFE